MTAPPESVIQMFYDHWLSAAKTLLACQWKLFEAQYQAGMRIMEAALGALPARPPDAAAATADEVRRIMEAGLAAPPARPPDAAAATANEVRRLERVAAERVSQGLAPPREVYQAPYRGQIDWGKLPAWAWPSDPELFEGTAHEG